MKLRYIAMLLVLLLLFGCGGDSRREVEKAINEAFRARADAVFLHKDQKLLNRFFSADAMTENKNYLAWAPHGSWENIKDPAYRYNLRIDKLKVKGKNATAEVYETVIISWNNIDSVLVQGSALNEEAWSNRLHKIKLELNPEGNWIVMEDLAKF